MNDTKTLERRVTVLEELVKKIIALPHLSNLAGRDSNNLVAHFKMMIASDKKKLATENITENERKALEAEIAINERRISPALDVNIYEENAVLAMRDEQKHVRMCTVKGAEDGGWIIVAEDPPEDS